jgi:hypothetical protein
MGMPTLPRVAQIVARCGTLSGRVRPVAFPFPRWRGCAADPWAVECYAFGVGIPGNAQLQKSQARMMYQRPSLAHRAGVSRTATSPRRVSEGPPARVIIRRGRKITPSPRYSGERVGVRGRKANAEVISQPVLSKSQSELADRHTRLIPGQQFQRRAEQVARRFERIRHGHLLFRPRPTGNAHRQSIGLGPPGRARYDLGKL